MRTKQQDRPAAAGPRVHLLSVLTLGILGLFMLSVVALLVADLSYRRLALATFADLLASAEIRSAIKLSLISSVLTLAAVMLVAVPSGYALSRYHFPGRVLADALVDLPIVLPPVVVGVSLLIFFASAPGNWIERAVESAGLSLQSILGIVLCQFFISVSYAIRAAKAAFDDVSRRLEDIALTLGCTPWQTFRRVTLPLARNGLVAGAVMAWARGIGVFGPLMVFVGTTRFKVETMPTRIYLELSIGRIENALAMSVMMLAMAGAALVAVHWLAPGRKWT